MSIGRRSRFTTFLSLLALAPFSTFGCSTTAGRSAATEPADGAAPISARGPRFRPDQIAPESRGIEGRAVPVHLREGTGRRGESALTRGLPPDLRADPPSVPRMVDRPFGRRAEPSTRVGPASVPLAPEPEVVADLVSSFASTTFDEVATYNAGIYYIPPDSHLAVGPAHVLTVVNTVIKVHSKTTGTASYTDDLSDFFAALSPETDTFDPKVLYDEFEDRWLVVTLEKVGTTAGSSAANRSKVLLGVSDDADPFGTWYIVSINTKVNISGTDYWFDYPGFAIDEEAIYVTGNMFSHVANASGGGRVLIVDKGVSGGLYAGAAASAAIYDPNAASGNFFPAIPLMPAHVSPAAPAGDLGTFLVGYSGLNDGFTSSICTIRIDDPVGSPVFTPDCMDLGSLIGNSVGDAPQSGTATLIDNGDRRTLDAKMRNGKLWVTSTVVPTTGANAGDSTAFFARFDVSPPDTSPLPLDELGYLGAEDSGTDTFTAYGAVAVNPLDRAVFGFSSFRSSSFASARFATKKPTDGAGVVGATQTLAAGVAKYIRTFGGANRWGDYSGVAVDPSDGCFWALNQYADTEGTNIGGELGRWATKVGRICPDGLVFTDDFGDGFDRWSGTTGAF